MFYYLWVSLFLLIKVVKITGLFLVILKGVWTQTNKPNKAMICWSS